AVVIHFCRVPDPCPFAGRDLPPCPIEESRHLGIPTINRTRVVASGDAGVGVTQSTGSDQDAMRISNPTAMRRPKIVRDHITEPGQLHRPIKPALPPVVALRAVSRPPLPPRKEEDIRVIRQLVQVAT